MPLELPRRFHVRPYTSAVLPVALERALRMLLVMVFSVLLIACANAAGLRLGETLARQRELEVRRALGASSWRILRLLLGEAVVVVMVSALAGVVFAALLVNAASRWLLSGSLLVRQFWIDVRLDLRACAFAVLTAALAVVVAGLLPAALRARGRERPRTALGARGASAECRSAASPG